MAPSHQTPSPHRGPQQRPSASPRSVFSGRHLGFLALAVIAMVCNVSLIRKLDQMEGGGGSSHYTTESETTFWQPKGGVVDQSALLAQVESLHRSVQALQKENEQLKQSLQRKGQEEHDHMAQQRELQGKKEQDILSLLLRGEEEEKSIQHPRNNQQTDVDEVQRNSRRRIRADAKVSSFAQTLNHSTPLPDALPLDYTTLPDPVGNSKKSSVDYHACCGLGHRLSRMSDANYVAQRLNLGLRSFWGFCGNLEVFYYLFGPQRENMLANVTDTGNYLRISNNVKETNFLARWPVQEGHSCDTKRCGFDKAEMDVRFYSDLIERFRFSPHVNKFRELYFRNKTVIGVHIRAGNGEGGDFVWKRRGIKNETAWVSNLVVHIKDIALSKENPVLFVASDTERMIDMLRERLVGVMDVLHVQQQRPEEGKGIMFGEKRAVLNEGEQCLHGWEMSLVDMILLSHSDAVIVGRPSSFRQTMPMSMMFAKPDIERRIEKPYCELDSEATRIHCYTDYKDWCCNGKTAFYLTQRKKQEYIHVPKVPFNLDEHRSGIHPRTTDRAQCLGRLPDKKQYCIPYHWGTYSMLPNRTAVYLPKGSLVQQAL